MPAISTVTSVTRSDLAERAARRDAVYAFNRLAELRLQQGDAPGARALLEQALALDSDNPNLHNNLALVEQDLGDYSSAITHVFYGLAQREDLHQLHYTLGLICGKLGYRQGAINAYARCIALKPDCAEAHLNLALQLFYEEHWREGWTHYEWRFEAHKPLGDFRARFDKPHWQGEELHGQKLLLYCEQGLGDTLMFARYIPKLYEMGAEIWIEAPAELVRLLRFQPGIERVIERPRDLTVKPEFPEHDLVCSFCSLPLYCPDFEPHFPYVRAEGRWGWGKTEERKPRVVLCWAGAAHHPDDKIRSFPRETFLPLQDLPIEFLGIHDGSLYTAPFITGTLPDAATAAPLSCFYETALLLKDVDLLITVDTAVAHLAGALNRPVWLLLAQPHDWRWPLVGDETQWYPSMRIFRQIKAGDWPEVIVRLKVALELWLEERAKAERARLPMPVQWT